MPPPPTSRSRSTSARSARLARRPSAEKGLTSGISKAILPALLSGAFGAQERGLSSWSRKRASGVVREASRKGGDAPTLVPRCEAFVRGAGVGSLAGQRLGAGGCPVLGRRGLAERNLFDEEREGQPHDQDRQADYEGDVDRVGQGQADAAPDHSTVLQPGPPHHRAGV